MAEDTVAGGGRDQTIRVVTKIEVTYRLENDPAGTERRLTVASEAGEVVDGVIMNAALVRKLAYRENTGYENAKNEKGTGPWKVTKSSSTELSSASEDSSLNPECVWLHNTDCTWFMYCADV